MKITVTALQNIARTTRQEVGRIDSEVLVEKALSIAIPSMADHAMQAGLKDAQSIAEKARENAKADGLSPGDKFQTVRDAVARALADAWQSQDKRKVRVAGNKSLKIGKRGELLVMARMLSEGFDVYIPWVDDHGVDAVVRWENGPFLQIQVKATGVGIIFPATFNTGGLAKDGPGFFVFYSEEWKTMWIMSRDEVHKHRNNNGHIDCFVQRKGEQVPKPELERFKAESFDRLKEES